MNATSASSSRDTVVARDRDDVVAELGDEHHVRSLVDRRQLLELRGGRSRHRREEPQVDRLVAEPLVEREHARFVVGRGPGRTRTVPPSASTTSLSQSRTSMRRGYAALSA